MSHSPQGQPLKGQTVLNLRAAEDAPALTQRLAALGATVIERPAIAFVAPLDEAAGINAYVDDLQPGRWIAFTSASAVHWTLRHCGELNVSMALLRGAYIAAIGRGTASALARAGLSAKVVPPEHFQAEGLLDALFTVLEPNDEVWLPRAEQGRETLVDGLTQAGHPVYLTPAYRTVAAPEGLGPVASDLEQGRIDWIVFTSSAVVTHFLSMLSPATRAAVGRARIACLGRITAQTAEAAGLPVTVVPERQDLPGLVDALARAAASLRTGKP